MLRPALALLVALLACRPGLAQPEPAKYWIVLTDKPPGAARGEAARVAVRALERRRLRGSAARPALADVPVAPAYVERLRAEGVEPVVVSRWLNAVSAFLDEDQREAVRRLPFVREVRPVARTATERSAPLSPVVIDYGPSALQLDLINARAPIEAGYTGEGVVVGFLDTTFDFTHPALAPIAASGRLLGVEDFTGQGQTNAHGLAVASVAVGFDEGDLVGPAFGAAVLAATTEYAPTETRQEEDFFVAGLEWLEAEGADVVNVSLGYSTFDAGEGDYTYADMDGNTALVTRAADIAASLGVVVVTSAGNEGASTWRYVTAPADADSVITVGAIRPDSTRASFSSVGPTADGRTKPDVVAPGVGIVYAHPSGGYATGGLGTSFSAPLVSGVVAQMLQANPALGPVDVREFLRVTASQAASPDTLRGWGVANAEAALQLALGLTAEPAAPSPLAVRVFPTVLGAGRRTLTVEGRGGRAGAPASLRLYDVLGREVGVLFDGPLPTGPFTAALPPVAAGVYFYRLSTDDGVASGRIVVQ